MRAGSLAFAAGIIATAETLRAPLGWDGVAALAAAALLWPLLAPRGWRWPAALLLGAAWAAGSAEALTAQRLPPTPTPVAAVIEARIAAIPEEDGRAVELEVVPRRLVAGDLRRLPGPRVRLRWYGDTPELRAGQVWRLPVRLRAPDGYLNPAGFDYQRWLFAHRFGATGYVRDGEAARLLDSRRGVDTLRQRIAEGMAQALPESPRLGLIQGLGVAVRHRIDEAQWRTLRETGTAHLLAISGLHIGMVAAAFGAAVSVLWRRIPPLVRRVPALLAGTLAGVAAAAAYAALAGLTLPTQRALVTVLVFAGALLARRSLSPWHSLAVAAAAVLLLDPWAALGAGFWLSFGAVAVILAATLGRPPQRGPAAWLRVQAVVGLGLLPVTALWFGELPWLSPLANLLAVPWVSAAVVPPVLLGVALLPASEVLAGGLWAAADTSLGGLMAVLRFLAGHLGALEAVPPPAYLAAAALLGVGCLIAPRGFPGRPLALPLLAALGLGAASPGGDDGRVVVFDTGAGLAAVIAADGRAVVYGAGPGGSLGAVRVAVGPYLEARRLELVAWVVPRGADPWAGAVAAARERWPQAEWVRGSACAGWRRRLGGLELRGTRRDDDCRLQVASSRGGAPVRLRPELGRGAPAWTVGAVGCDGGEAGCSAALRAGADYATADTGALTLDWEGGAPRLVSEYERRGRVYHRRRGWRPWLSAASSQ